MIRISFFICMILLSSCARGKAKGEQSQAFTSATELMMNAIHVAKNGILPLDLEITARSEGSIEMSMNDHTYKVSYEMLEDLGRIYVSQAITLGNGTKISNNLLVDLSGKVHDRALQLDSLMMNSKQNIRDRALLARKITYEESTIEAIEFYAYHQDDEPTTILVSKDGILFFANESSDYYTIRSGNPVF